MPSDTDHKWLSASLFYGGPWEAFLTKAVLPYADVVVQTGVAERFFFQRNWEGGPNIRLWFKGGGEVVENILRPNLKEHFQQYFESRPSIISNRRCETAQFRTPQEYPDNSVQFLGCPPPLTHIGGEPELPVFEKQFQASSEAVLHLIKGKAARWTNSEMVSAAIKLHLGFAYSVGMGLQEAGAFFAQLARTWAGQQWADGKSTGSSRPFQKVFARQRKDLVSYQAALWELFKKYGTADAPIIANWLNTNAELGIELDLALAKGQLEKRPQVLPELGTENKLQRRAWAYYRELVQLTNNRLGLLGQNEGYLFFVLEHSLRALAASMPKMAGVGA